MTSSASADVIVVGGGIVGLAAARALARSGTSVLLSAPEHAGTATSAAAGVISPCLNPHPGSGFLFACAGRDMFPRFASELLEETGIDAHVSLNGVLRVALNHAEAEALRAERVVDARWLDPREVGELEPALSDCVGAILLEHDGIVANERAHAALRTAVRRHPCVRWTARPVARLETEPDVGVTLESGDRWRAAVVVLAAGCWTPTIGGLPRMPAVSPGRGQAISLFAPRLTRAVFASGGYITPRPDGRVFIGSTLEDAGFDASTTPAAINSFRDLARQLLGRAGAAGPVEAWAGLRPMTADRMPLIGRDPEFPGVIYATGHSKNGILMGPLTGEVVARICLGLDPGHDLSLFQPDRFAPGTPILSNLRY